MFQAKAKALLLEILSTSPDRETVGKLFHLYRIVERAGRKEVHYRTLYKILKTY